MTKLEHIRKIISEIENHRKGHIQYFACRYPGEDSIDYILRCNRNGEISREDIEKLLVLL